jgi:hypothetical protein
MKIAYLDAGPDLDYWVAKAQGLKIHAVRDGKVIVGEPPNLYVFAPSTDWAQAGPIIEAKQIDLISDFGRWMARHGRRDDYARADPSPLVTAMRAYLMYEYGDEVPDPVLLPAD